MRQWTLQQIIKRFDSVVYDVDFNQMPDRESEEYRQLVLQTANDQIFSRGRYTDITEWTLELFDIDEIPPLTRNLTAINALTDAERQRFRFYMDLAGVCYPLFRAHEVDWTAWPWGMNSASSSLDNQELFDFITDGRWPMLSAAILYNLQQRIWMDEEFYSSVARQEAANLFNHTLNHEWSRLDSAHRDRSAITDDERRKLAVAVSEYANSLWFIENHMHVGRQLGFDHLAQSVYDAFDTFIDRTYRHRQVDFARALAEWIHANMTVGEPHPAPEKVEALHEKVLALLAEYDVTSPDIDYTWNILTLDVLGMSLTSDEEPQDDDEDWEFGDEDWETDGEDTEDGETD